VPTVGRPDRIYEHFCHLEEISSKIEMVILSEPPSHHKIRQLSEIFPNFIYEVNNKTTGYGYSILKLTELATSDYILFSSDEDILQLNSLKSILKIIDERNDLSSIVTNFSVCDRLIWNFPNIPEYRKICESKTDEKVVINQPAALELFYGSQSHLTGIIIKRDRIDKSKVIDFCNTDIDGYVSSILHSQVVTEGNVLYFNKKLFKSGRQAKSNHPIAYHKVKSRSQNILIRLNQVIPRLTNDPFIKQKLIKRDIEFAVSLLYSTILYKNCKLDVRFLLKKDIVLNKYFLLYLIKLPLLFVRSQLRD
jgi:hypothetical protein